MFFTRKIRLLRTIYSYSYLHILHFYYWTKNHNPLDLDSHKGDLPTFILMCNVHIALNSHFSDNGGKSFNPAIIQSHPDWTILSPSQSICLRFVGIRTSLLNNSPLSEWMQSEYFMRLHKNCINMGNCRWTYTVFVGPQLSLMEACL